MSTVLQLREHREVEYRLSQEQVAVIQKSFKDEVVLTPTLIKDHYILRAGSHVGFLQLPGGLTLVIEPKIPIDTIFFLLTFVYDPTKEIFRQEEQRYTTIDGLFEYVVEVFTHQVEDLIARGILRNYQVRHDDLLAIRGKLQIMETLRRRPVIRDRHWCSFSHFTPDVPENVILRATVHMLKFHAYRAADLPSRLRRLERALAEVALDPEPLDLFDLLEFHRLNEHYRPTLSLACLLLEHITFTGAVGRQAFLSFLIDMDWLFEKVIEAFLQRWSPMGLQAVGQRQYALDRGAHVKVRPDVILLRGRKPVFALDAKYKLDPNRADIYQILAYCHALGIQEAALAYPYTEKVPVGRLSIREPGNVGIHYVPIDLSGTPEEIEVKGKAFAERIGQLIHYAYSREDQSVTYAVKA